jgi:hypothetical protein
MREALLLVFICSAFSLQRDYFFNNTFQETGGTTHVLPIGVKKTGLNYGKEVYSFGTLKQGVKKARKFPEISRPNRYRFCF